MLTLWPLRPGDIVLLDPYYGELLVVAAWGHRETVFNDAILSVVLLNGRSMYTITKLHHADVRLILRDRESGGMWGEEMLREVFVRRR